MLTIENKEQTLDDQIADEFCYLIQRLKHMPITEFESSLRRLHVLQIKLLHVQGKLKNY